MIDKAAVGLRIASLRKGLGYSQASFAEKLSVSAQAVSKWETGAALPDVDMLVSLSWIGNVPINDMLTGEGFIAPVDGLDRGLMTVKDALVCPKCREALALCPHAGEGKAVRFACANGHGFDLVDGVLFFDTREIEGELWSLWLRNYDHYLKEQRHAGNPTYFRGGRSFAQIAWDEIEKLRPRTIVDFACGTGSGIKHIISRISWPTTVIMADLSHRILKWNRVFYSDEWKNPYVDMVYLACDCANVPLADGSVAMVFSYGGFESMRETMKGFQEGYRILKPGKHAVYNMSVVGDHASQNSQNWLRLYMGLDPSYHPQVMPDLNQWLGRCRETGYTKNTPTKVYDELPAPEGDVFPFDHEVLQWMACYQVVSQK